MDSVIHYCGGNDRAFCDDAEQMHDASIHSVTIPAVPCDSRRGNSVSFNGPFTAIDFAGLSLWASVHDNIELMECLINK